MSTLEGVQYIGGIMMHVGDTMSISEDAQYIGGYHEYIEGCSVHQGDIMMHVGEQVDKSLSISIENPGILNIRRCTHDIPPMYRTSPDVLMISPRCTHDIPRCAHDIPPMY